jgi:hypothetical protein
LALNENSETFLRTPFGRWLSIAFLVHDMFACCDLKFIYYLSTVEFMRCTLRKVDVRNELLTYSIYVYDDFVWLVSLAKLTEVTR